MRKLNALGIIIATLTGTACDTQTAPMAPQALASLVTPPGGALGERIIVCKSGGEGSYDFTYSGSGTASGGFTLQPGECWQIGVFGGTGASLTISETPRTGHEVVSIAVDQLFGTDQFVTGTNSVTGVLASGNPREGALVTFTNRVLPPPPPGDEGCTPGYWKNHELSWPATGYSRAQLFSSVFTGATMLSSTLTLNGALGLGGGSGIGGAEKILARAAVAALLNAASPGVNYALTTADVIAQVNAALASQDRDTMLILASTLDGYNNAGCPLN